MKKLLCKITYHFFGLMTGHFESDKKGSYFICNFCKEKDYFTQRVQHLVSNMKKIILDLCGGTGAWSAPYAEAGYGVCNITLPAFDLRDVRYNSDTLYFYSHIFKMNRKDYWYK